MDQLADNAPVTTDFAAEAFLARLAERGIEYVFANAGTDFAPIIEAVARNSGGRKYPRFVTAPHENLAMAMANGYYRVAGKPAAVMLHVTVGTANAICQLMNMSRDNVPVLLCAGRTPVTETGHIASRNGAIHWGQESFDQGGMVREFVKWDYETARRPAGRCAGRSRARHCDERAARAGLSVSAARGAGRRRRADASRQCAAARQRLRRRRR